MSKEGLTGLQVPIFFKRQFTRAGDVVQLVTHLLSMHKSLNVIPQCWGKIREKEIFTTKSFLIWREKGNGCRTRSSP